MPRPDRISRDALYELVWSKPTRDVASGFDISDVGLAKICRRLNIPRPPRGHWAKLAAGKPSPQTPLPPAQLGAEIEWTTNGNPACAFPANDGWQQPDAAARPKSANVSVPSNPPLHPLVEEAAKHMLKVRSQRYSYIIPTKGLMLHCFLSRENKDAGLAAVNRVLMTFIQRRHQIMLAPSHTKWLGKHVSPLGRRKNECIYDGPGSWHPHRPTLITIGQVCLGFAFVELTQEEPGVSHEFTTIRLSEYKALPQSKRSRHYEPLARSHPFPSGRYKVVLYSPYEGTSWQQEWAEEPKRTLISMIPDMVRTAEEKALEIPQMIKEAEERAEIQRIAAAEQQHRWRLQSDRHLRNDSRKASKDDLHAVMVAWRESRMIEAFFSEVESHLASLSEEQQVAMHGRLAAARALMDGPTAWDRFMAWRDPAQRWEGRLHYPEEGDHSFSIQEKDDRLRQHNQSPDIVSWLRL